MTIEDFKKKLFDKLVITGEVDKDDKEQFMLEANEFNSPFGVFAEIVTEEVNKALNNAWKNKEAAATEEECDATESDIY